MRDQDSRTLLVTGCEQRTLPYVSIRDDLSPSCMQIVKKVSCSVRTTHTMRCG